MVIQSMPFAAASRAAIAEGTTNPAAVNAMKARRFLSAMGVSSDIVFVR
jgi:hypothetical protein